MSLIDGSHIKTDEDHGHIKYFLSVCLTALAEEASHYLDGGKTFQEEKTISPDAMTHLPDVTWINENLHRRPVALSS